MTESRHRRSVVQTLLLDLLIEQLRSWRPPAADVELVDVGGGTGQVSAALATDGYRVTVIDPSPDALASLQRRAAEAGLSERLRGVQGDAADLAELIGPGRAAGVLCHRVLEVVDDPTATLAAIAAVLPPDGVLSLLVAQRPAAVWAQALAGHFGQARAVAADRTRFDTDAVLRSVARAGFVVSAVHGLGAVSEHVAESLVDASPRARAELLSLESELSQDPPFLAVAPFVHVLAHRGESQPSSSLR